MSIKTILWIAIGVIVLVLAIFGLVKYIKSHSLEQIREDVYQLFLFAERNIVGTKKGQARLDWVVNRAYFLLPKFIQGLISIDFLRKILDKWFKGIKDLLDDGKANESVGDSNESQN